MARSSLNSRTVLATAYYMIETGSLTPARAMEACKKHNVTLPLEKPRAVINENGVSRASLFMMTFYQQSPPKRDANEDVVFRMQVCGADLRFVPLHAASF